MQNLRILDSSPTYSPIMRCIYFYQIIRLTLILPMAASPSALNTGPSDLSDGRLTGDRVCSPTATEPDCCSLGRDCIGNDKSLSQDSTTTSANHSVFATLTLVSSTISPSTPNPPSQVSNSFNVRPRGGSYAGHPSCSSHDTCLSGAALAGIVAGGLFGIGLLVAIAYFWNMKRRERQEASQRAAEFRITDT